MSFYISLPSIYIFSINANAVNNNNYSFEFSAKHFIATVKYCTRCCEVDMLCKTMNHLLLM